MSQTSKEIKAQRKQHRKDHRTDLDRQLFKDYKGDQKGRIAARKAAYQTDNKTAADFDFDKFGKGHISQGEMRHLKQQGHSNQSIMDAAYSSGSELSDRVKNRFAKWEAKKTTSTPPTNQAPTPTPTPPTNQAPTPTPTPPTNQAPTPTPTPPTNQAPTPTPDPQPAQEIENPKSVVEAKERAQEFINTGDAKNSPGAAVGTGNTAISQELINTGDAENSPGAAVGTGNTANTQEDIGNMTNETVTDNDQTSNITGNNNYVDLTQDNSVRNYGGDTRVFNYQGGSGENSLYDSPVSAATMGGFYDVDDSPAAQAKFMGLHTDLNADAQKRFAGDAMSIVNKYKTMGQGTSVDYEAENQKSLQRSKDAAAIASNNIFGDQELWRGNLGKYNFGASPKPIDDPFEKDKDDDDD